MGYVLTLQWSSCNKILQTYWRYKFYYKQYKSKTQETLFYPTTIILIVYYYDTPFLSYEFTN